jgi:hypothetical protein
LMVVEHLEIGNMKKLILLFLIPFLFIGGNVGQAETIIPDKPTNGIYDPNHYLSENISAELEKENSNSDTQIGIYIVDTLDGKSIEEQANEVARSWKIGFSDTNKGALIAIAINDRKFRIETSNELNTTLTDSKAKSILDNVKPEMRSKNYNLAVQKIISEIKTISSEDSVSQTQTNKSGGLEGAFENIFGVELKDGPGIEGLPKKLFSIIVLLLLPITFILFSLTLLLKLVVGVFGSGIGNSYGSKGHSSGSYSSGSSYFGGYSSGSSYSSGDSSSRSSSSSSSGWSGGGFDGGGASGGW